MGMTNAGSDGLRLRWSDLASRWAALSVGFAAVSVVTWIVFAAQVRSAGGLGGITEGPWSPNWGVGLSLGVAVLASAFSAAAFVVSSVASMLGRTVEQISRDAASRGHTQA